MRFVGVGGAAAVVVAWAVVACSGSESSQGGKKPSEDASAGFGGAAGAAQSGTGGAGGSNGAGGPGGGPGTGGANGDAAGGGGTNVGGSAGVSTDMDAGAGGRLVDAAAGPMDAGEPDVAVGSAGGAAGTGGSLGAGGLGAGGVGAGGGSGTGGVASGGASGTGGAATGGAMGAGGATGTGTCRSSFDCAPGVCDVVANRCFGCNVDADCPQQQECRNRACVAIPTCATSLNCANRTDGRTVCTGGHCVQCGSTNDCAAQTSCLANQCRPQCNSDNDCTPLGMLCNFGSGVCVGCLNSAACATDQFCKSSVCVPDTCPASRTVCAGNSVVTCNAEGSGTTPVKSCGSGVCVEDASGASCIYPHCTNKTRDANETDVDCGGGECAACADGKSCSLNADCTARYCKLSYTYQDAGPSVEGGIASVSGTCTESSCTDQIADGLETSVDCGGGARGSGCPKCPTYSPCVDKTDCVSNNCVAFGLNFYICY